MTYRSMTGLGLLEMTPSGIRSLSEPTCVSQAEHDEAVGLCAAQRSGTLTGLGVEYKMSGRLAAFPPCSVADSNICPTPTCIDTYTAGVIANCANGRVLNPDFDCVNDTAAQWTAIALSKLPFCPGAGLPAPAACITPEFAKLRDYCNAGGGDNKDWNVLCWLGQHDPAWWAKLMAAPPCAVTSCPPGHALFKGQCAGICDPEHAWDANGNCVTCPAGRSPFHFTDGTSVCAGDCSPGYVWDANGNCVALTVATTCPPGSHLVGSNCIPMFHKPTTQASSTSAMWGILALLAVGGGGYYMYRKYKK
jgi:hypothetical protein